MSDIERNKALARREQEEFWAERWDNLDWLGALRQLGLIPAT